MGYDEFSAGIEDEHGKPLATVTTIGKPSANGSGPARSAESEIVLPAPDNPMAVARELANERYTNDGKPTLRHWRGGWWEWAGSHWREVEERHIRQAAYLFTEDAVFVKSSKTERWKPNRYKVADLLAALGALNHTAVTTTMPAWVPGQPGPAASEFVSVRNGLLHIETELLQPHDPQLFNGVSVPFDYDPDARGLVRWLEFLEQLWPDDPDSIAVLQQFFGYVLSGRTDLQKILLLVGPTRAGKGVIARVLKGLIGTGNCAGPTLASLATNFGLQPLIGKPLAIISDARLAGGNAYQVVERLLSISGEDMLTIDRKYQDPWTGTLPSRFLVISNELPRFGDASGAIVGRFVILNLTHSFLGKENPRLTDELLTELPAILNWALAGLRQLQSEGSFTQPESSVDAIVALQDLVSPVAAFVRDACTRGPHEVRIDVIYDAWKGWAEDNGHKPGSSSSFGRDIRAVVPGLRVRRPREGDEPRHRYYLGVKLGKDDA